MHIIASHIAAMEEDITTNYQKVRNSAEKLKAPEIQRYRHTFFWHLAGLAYYKYKTFQHGSAGECSFSTREYKSLLYIPGEGEIHIRAG